MRERYAVYLPLLLRLPSHFLLHQGLVAALRKTSIITLVGTDVSVIEIGMTDLPAATSPRASV